MPSMAPERWQRVKDLLCAALERPREERGAFLEEACGADHSLRGEVESLLAGHGEAGAFLSQPANMEATAATASSPSGRLASGTRLGAYEVVSFLGAGGMGAVYKARDTRLGRAVAIKVLPGEATGPDRRRRFEREAHAISQLNHPHICALYDVGQHDGSQYLVMEYLEGESLAARLSRGPLSPEEALRCATQIAGALEEAHGHGIVHRDLKPANVVLTRQGAKLLDFGIAKLRPAGDEGATSPLTRDGLIVGTPRYMAPEQLEGNAVDEKADVFAFGLVLYEMLSGRKAFAEPSGPRLAAAILEGQPPPLSRAQPLTPPALESLVQRCLAKDPADRPSSPDLLAALRRPEASARPPGWRARRRTAAGAAILLLLAAAGWLARARDARPLPAADPPVPSLAVMPFVNLTGGIEEQYLGDGLAEDLINVLARVQGLTVVARTSSFQFRRGDVPADEIGRRLGVSHLVEGSVRRSGGRVRITAQLVAAPQGRALWADSYDRELSDLLTVQEDIARSVGAVLRVRLAMTSRPRPDFQAYDAYLRGRAAWSLRTREGLDQAVTLFQQAIAREPGFAEAYAGLADAVLLQGRLRFVRYSEAFPRASGAAERALALDPDLAEGHAARAALHLERLEWEDSERRYRRAIELKPSYATAHQWYALMLFQVGRLDQGLRVARRALELDPLAVTVVGTLATGLYLKGDLEEARESARRAAELSPDYPGPLFSLSRIEAARGRFTEAFSLARQAAHKAPGMPQGRALLARAHAQLGQTDAARAILRELEQEAEPCVACIVDVHLSLKDLDQALAWTKRGGWTPGGGFYFPRSDPASRTFHGDPRFAELLARIGVR